MATMNKNNSKGVNNVQTSKELDSTSIKQFCLDNDFVQIGTKIRANVNDYLYLTFINSENEALNVYFSVNASDEVEEGQDVTGELLNSLQVFYVTNSQGDSRVKLGFKSSKRLNIFELLD